MFTWFLTGLSLTGVILNCLKNRRCFILWMVSNASWAVVDFRAADTNPQLYAQAWLFVVYFILAVWGWFRWKDDEHKTG